MLNLEKALRKSNVFDPPVRAPPLAIEENIKHAKCRLEQILHEDDDGPPVDL